MDDSNPSYSDLHRLAIDAALNCQWDEAVKLNQQIIEVDPGNITSLNRLARAFCELGKYSLAKKIYLQVLELDPYNSIAEKNMKKIVATKDNNDKVLTNNSFRTYSAAMFLQEPGVTKMVNLTKIAEPGKLLMLSAGSMVELLAKTKNITVTQEDHYIGVLPDDLAYLLLKLMKGGNKYQAIIKSVKSNAVTILIREVYRSKKFRNQPSFLDENHIISQSSDNLTMLNSEPADEREDETEEITG